jgi:hypothetical protein
VNPNRILTIKSAFTVDYRCSKCKSGGVKLWRLPNGAKDKQGHELLCAACLSPDKHVDEDGRLHSEWGLTDQVNEWLPAVPSGDTFWGYTSVPKHDVMWWRALPTYAKGADSKGRDR